jgi:hypothetical protein
MYALLHTYITAAAAAAAVHGILSIYSLSMVYGLWSMVIAKLA